MVILWTSSKDHFEDFVLQSHVVKVFFYKYSLQISFITYVLVNAFLLNEIDHYR